MKMVSQVFDIRHLNTMLYPVIPNGKMQKGIPFIIGAIAIVIVVTGIGFYARRHLSPQFANVGCDMRPSLQVRVTPMEGHGVVPIEQMGSFLHEIDTAEDMNYSVPSATGSRMVSVHYSRLSKELPHLSELVAFFRRRDYKVQKPSCIALFMDVRPSNTAAKRSTQHIFKRFDEIRSVQTDNWYADFVIRFESGWKKPENLLLALNATGISAQVIHVEADWDCSG